MISVGLLRARCAVGEIGLPDTQPGVDHGR
jgi:hypothetical protein